MSETHNCPPSLKLEDHPWLHPVRHKDGTVRTLVNLLKWVGCIARWHKTSQKKGRSQRATKKTSQTHARTHGTCFNSQCPSTKSRRAEPTRRRIKHPLRETNPPGVTKRPVWTARCWWPPSVQGFRRIPAKTTRRNNQYMFFAIWRKIFKDL